MTEICLDANIILSCLCPDEDNPDGKEVIQYVISNGVSAWSPAVLNFEVAAALNKKEGLKLIREDHAMLILHHFFSLPIFLVWNDELLRNAIKLQKRAGMTFNDTCYLALAMGRNIPLVTEDQDLLKKGRKIYKEIYSAQAFLAL